MWARLTNLQLPIVLFLRDLLPFNFLNGLSHVSISSSGGAAEAAEKKIRFKFYSLQQ